MVSPLAERLRPRTLEDFVGQSHLVGPNQPLRLMIEQDALQSVIFWGPPGVGKTTLARIIANQLDRQFFSLNAVSAGVKDVRAVIDTASKLGNAILFIDEIHRFNKAQQDALLSAVESGIITLIGATTENPSFEVISALLSRSQVYVLQNLSREDLELLLDRALETDAAFKGKSVVKQELDSLFRLSGGDARRLYNLLELILATSTTNEIIINNDLVESVAQKKTVRYDKNGDMHYDVISAFIKSMRGSDPNAAVYYLARMIAGGEDVKFIARRMLILASEDIGMANPNALLLANACFEAVSKIGYPESRIILSQTAIYLATSAKSNSSYTAIDKALAEVKKSGDLDVPLALRNAQTKLMKSMGYGQDYKYAHSEEGNFADMEFLPDSLSGSKFYEPGDNSREDVIAKQLLQQWGSKYS